MLIRFAVDNFLSFKEVTEFSMIAGKVTRHASHCVKSNQHKILRGGFIFGANASGKTNLLKAISFAKTIVTQGLDSVSFDQKYFKIDSLNKRKPGVFQFDICINDNCYYSYGFAVSYEKGSVVSEWLYQLNNKIQNSEDFCIFERSFNEKRKTFDIISSLEFQDYNQTERFKIYLEDARNLKMSKTLFLKDIVKRSPASVKEYQPFIDVFHWFERLTVVFSTTKSSAITKYFQSNEEQSRLEKMLNYFDTGIESIFKRKVDLNKVLLGLPVSFADVIRRDMYKTLNVNRHGMWIQEDTLFDITNVDDQIIAEEILFNHGNDNELFKYGEESDGTQRIIDLMPLFLGIFDNAVIFIDELDRSLHTKIALEFIKYFYKQKEGKRSQLIVTTHDTNFLNLDLIRQDEIWFVERKSDHSSNIYSLNKFKARFDKKIVKDYLIGRYGAIPKIEDLLD